MIKRSRLAMAIVIAAPLAMTAAGKSVAAPVLPGASPLKASSASALTDVSTSMTMDRTLIVRSTNTEAIPIGIPAFGVGSTPGTTTTSTSKPEFVAALRLAPPSDIFRLSSRRRLTSRLRAAASRSSAKGLVQESKRLGRICGCIRPLTRRAKPR
jgi:hypothetical protein